VNLDGGNSGCRDRIPQGNAGVAEGRWINEQYIRPRGKSLKGINQLPFMIRLEDLNLQIFFFRRSPNRFIDRWQRVQAV
jgi:hypothetical protein